MKLEQRSPRELAIIALLFASGGVVGLLDGSGISAAMAVAAGIVFAILALIARRNGGEESRAP